MICCRTECIILPFCLKKSCTREGARWVTGFLRIGLYFSKQRINFSAHRNSCAKKTRLRFQNQDFYYVSFNYTAAEAPSAGAAAVIAASSLSIWNIPALSSPTRLILSRIVFIVLSSSICSVINH